MPQENTNPPNVAVIPLKELHTPDWNPRQFMDESNMQDLMAYLKSGGVVPRIWVWKGDGKPPREVISGQRRCVAYERLGRTEIEAEILDIPLEEAKILAITTNQDEEMHWWDWYKAIGRMAGEHGWNQRELASRLGCSQSMVSRAVQITEALNPEAHAQLDLILINKNPTNAPHFELPESVVYTLTSLAEVPPKGQKDDPEAKKRLEASRKKVAVALKIVIDREMTEAKAKQYVGWIKDGNDPAKYDPTRSTPSGRSGLKINPNDPHRELWKMMPEWVTMTLRKDGGYEFHVHQLDKYAAPAAAFAFLARLKAHEQRVQRVENPEAIPPNPYKDMVEELFEKGVREALEDWERVKKGNGEKVKKQPFERPAAPQGGSAANSPSSPSGRNDAGQFDRTQVGPAGEPEGELPVNPDGSLKSPVTEDDMKRLGNEVKEVLGQVVKDPKEVMKKLLGGLFPGEQDK